MAWMFALAACTPTESAIVRVYPNMLVSPESVDFGNVAVHYSSSAEVTILNGGAVDLEISGLDLAEDGPTAFSVSPGSEELPLVVEPDGATTLTLGFAPETYLTYTGELAITSNDEDLPTFYLPLAGVGADAPMPDIDVDPLSHDFGYVDVGSQNYVTINISNLGEGPLNLGNVEQLAGGSGAFSLTSGNVSDFTIPAGQYVALVVAYVPTNDAGDFGKILIESDDPDESSITVTLLGNGGSTYEYPVAVIDAVETTEPRQTLTFDGSGSYDPGGREPLIYEWTLESKPEGSGTTGLVNTETDRTYLYVDVAGDYVVSLKVTNTDGVTGSPARHTVSAIPNEYLHVELSWDTANADLDLHLLNGAGNYYDARNDCTWCNKSPDWGEVGEIDDPSLDIDDLSGYGPENVNIDAPADGYYPVMVHYYEDRGDDAVVATVRVYLNGSLFDTVSHVLYRNEVWTVGDIKWPDATFGVVDTVEGSALRGCE